MSMLEEAKKQLGAAYKFAEIDDESWQRLQYPQKTLNVTIPMRHDDDTLKMYQAFRCQYDTTLGPAKGGVRYHPSVAIKEYGNHVSSALNGKRPHCQGYIWRYK